MTYHIYKTSGFGLFQENLVKSFPDLTSAQKFMLHMAEKWQRMGGHASAIDHYQLIQLMADWYPDIITYFIEKE